jgi:hypothetical protein
MSMTSKLRGSLPAALLLAAAGCRPVETRFEIASFRDPAAPERFSEKFDGGHFMVDAHRNWTLAFALEPSDAASADAGRPAGEPGMAQYLLVEVFWRPLPGITYAESSQTNASLCYCLVSSGRTITYEGAGFVSFSYSRDGRSVTGRIESSSLVPARFLNDPADLFGPCRLTGAFTAREDRRRVTRVMQRIRRTTTAPASSS